MMNFEGKTAIITGGGSGIGLETAKQLIRHGASVVINGRNEAKLKTAADSLGAPERVAFLAGSIASPDTAKKLVMLAEERFGGVDLLFNNAGIFEPKSFLEIKEQEYDQFLDIVLKGKFFMAQAAAKAMKKRGGGSIIHTGSMWAEQAVAATPSSAYSAANAGVHALVRNLSRELAEHQIRINAVAPAVVETPVYGTFIPEDQVRGVLDGFHNFHPLGRNGQPVDVVNAMLFLASDQASWITGTILPVDGGVLASRS